MLLLFETPAGYSLFKVANEKKYKKTSVEDLFSTHLSSVDKARKLIQLESFQPFADTADALSAATSLMEGKMSPSLQSFLKQVQKDESLVVADKGLAVNIKEEMPSTTVSTATGDSKMLELFRGIRTHMEGFLSQQEESSNDTMKAMQLGLSHSLSRYKLKFSADKVDTMVIQAVGLLDELDKEINTYAMRVKEWYGWHFPEMQGIVGDNVQYAKLVLTCGIRSDYEQHDLSEIVDDSNVESVLKEAATLSMGTEISELDIIHIKSLAEQVLSLTEYRAQLFEYLKHRMVAIAPNLTILVGELVGARLISHSGSLMQLAKQPASTIQILGAEKALFRALKTKHDTPKYGLIYHASLVGQAAPKHKGKISRVLAAKTALAVRVDALREDDDMEANVGYEGRAKVEARLRQLEGGSYHLDGLKGAGGLTAKKTTTYLPAVAKEASGATQYNESSDMVLTQDDDEDKKDSAKKKKKRKSGDGGDETDKKKKSKKKRNTEDDDDDDEEEEKDSEDNGEEEKKKKKKKKRKSLESEDGEETPKKKKKKRKADEEEEDGDDDKAAKKAAKKSKKEKRKSKEK